MALIIAILLFAVFGAMKMSDKATFISLEERVKRKEEVSERWWPKISDAELERKYKNEAWEIESLLKQKKNGAILLESHKEKIAKYDKVSEMTKIPVEYISPDIYILVMLSEHGKIYSELCKGFPRGYSIPGVIRSTPYSPLTNEEVLRHEWESRYRFRALFWARNNWEKQGVPKYDLTFTSREFDPKRGHKQGVITPEDEDFCVREGGSCLWGPFDSDYVNKNIRYL